MEATQGAGSLMTPVENSLPGANPARGHLPRRPRSLNHIQHDDAGSVQTKPKQQRRQRDNANGTGDRANRNTPNGDAGQGGQQHQQQGPPRNPRRNNPSSENQRRLQGGNAEPSSTSSIRPLVNRRRANFGAGLTVARDETSANVPTANGSAANNHASKPPQPFKGKQLPRGDDLTSSLTRALSTPPFPDCPICFNTIRPEHAIWSCSPSIQILLLPANSASGSGHNNNDHQQAPPQYCWTSFHVKCIRSWADKSVKAVADAWHARGELDRKGEWRCPGCQAKREEVPSGYWCFCGSTTEPKPGRLSTPHSCGNSCSRLRASGCGHPCPLSCHPGPCPPCQITTQLDCWCPRRQILSFSCGLDAKGAPVLAKDRDQSCGNTCGRTLNCGLHSCASKCHSGECANCEVEETVRCYCGKEDKIVKCGVGEPLRSAVEGEGEWLGRFGCEQVCGRPFDCGKHTCQKTCHTPSSKPPPCPRSPDNITTCPCGKHKIEPSPTSSSTSSTSSSFSHTLLTYKFTARLSCTDGIPTCTSICEKPHISEDGTSLTCEHPCSAPCHEGPCPPCSIEVVRPCRCGATTKGVRCSSLTSTSALIHTQEEILCDKPCLALRACGRHQCRRICCPLASLAIPSNKRSRKRAPVAAPDDPAAGIGEEHGGLHECDLVCLKMLSCGLHRCEERDHKGACGRCLRSSFEELICPCGSTILQPPIPCGTVISCPYPCQREPPCQHPRTPQTQHPCHPAEVACPPCPILVEKLCACGKKIVPNVRCSLETSRVGCGSVCAKLMKCGFHHCERLCHADECSACTAPCGKARKSCLPNNHPCTQPCHAPAACSETEPCQAPITLTCSCGRIKQTVLCSRTAASPALPRHSSSTASSESSSTGNGNGHAEPNSTTNLKGPRCTYECDIAKRNAKLADALGINISAGVKADKDGVVYGEEFLGFARMPGNAKFLGDVERAFREFISSDKRTHVLPHMISDRRKFVHDLAAVYRMDTQMIDQEPHRSVQLVRRIDTRIPSPLLSQFLASSTSLGKLADLRAVNQQRGPTSSNASASSSSGMGGASGGGAPIQAGPAGAWRSTAPLSSMASGGPRGWTSVVSSSIKHSAATSSPLNWATAKSTLPVAGNGNNLSAGRSVSRTASPLAAGAGGVSGVSGTVQGQGLEPQVVPDNWEDDADV